MSIGLALQRSNDPQICTGPRPQTDSKRVQFLSFFNFFFIISSCLRLGARGFISPSPGRGYLFFESLTFSQTFSNDNDQYMRSAIHPLGILCITLKITTKAHLEKCSFQFHVILLMCRSEFIFVDTGDTIVAERRQHVCSTP